MSNKRKRNPTKVAARANDRDDGVDHRSPMRLENVENYPRKRISVACNLCRFRKTKCDADRPSCSFCSGLGIECHYRNSQLEEPVEKRRISPNPHESLSVRDSIRALESKLRELEGEVKVLRSERLQWLDPSRTPISYPPAFSIPPKLSRSNINDKMPSLLHRRGSPSSTVPPKQNGFVFRQTRPEAYTARPSLLTFSCPPYLEAESWDDIAEFYTDEIKSGEYFYTQFDRCLNKLPDISNPTLRRLQQSFVDNVLGWMPIFEAEVASAIVNKCCAAGFVTRGLDSCLSMFILAIGAIAHDSAEVGGEELPGIDYFIHACQMLERLTLLTENIQALHCRILQAAYFKLAIRPVQSWNTITQAARDCMHVLSSSSLQSLESNLTESWNRAFWACSIIVEELEATMKMHPIGHRVFQEIVPLPRFEDEDTGFYYFLAQISLRKMLQDVLDVVGYREGKVIYAPVVTAELRKQAQEWYSHLPPAIRFPIDESPVFDARKSFLRAQYTSMYVVLEWASVLRVFEAYATADDMHDSEELTLAKVEAQECFRYCVLYLSVAEEQLVNWKLGTHNTLWTCFAFLATLIICYRSPTLAFVPETTEEKYIHDAFQMLRSWQNIPFVARGLCRMSSMMKRAGIVVETVV